MTKTRTWFLLISFLVAIVLFNIIIVLIYQTKREPKKPSYSYFQAATTSENIDQHQSLELRNLNISIDTDYISNTSLNFYVISLENNTDEPGRLDNFFKTWESTFPDLHFNTILTKRESRGVGVVKGSIEIFKDAINNSYDLIIILEDDVKPFKTENDTNWRNEFYKRIQIWPEDSPALFLGAHHIRGDYLIDSLNFGVSRIKFSLGAYAYIVRNSYFKHFLTYFENQLHTFESNANTTSLDGDVDWWDDLLKGENRTAYITNPLLVDHPFGFSSTWGRERNDSWVGNPFWWEFTKVADEKWGKKLKVKEQRLKTLKRRHRSKILLRAVFYSFLLLTCFCFFIYALWKFVKKVRSLS